MGNKIKEIRKIKQLTQRDVEKGTGFSQSQIAKWEKNISEPTLPALIALSDYFGYSIDYIAGREDEDGTIVISGNHLSDDETALLDKLRKLQPIKKKIIYRYVDFLLDEQKNGK